MTHRPETLREERPPLTVPEAAAELRVSPVTLRRWIAQGLIVSTRPSRQYLIPAREVDRLLRPVGQR